MLSPIRYNMVNPFTSGPIALYRNVPIEPQYYAPRVFIIDDVVLGPNTLISTTIPTDYVPGQLIRLIIPNGYGCTQLNEVSGLVIGPGIIPGNDPYVPVVEISLGGTNLSFTFTSNLLSFFTWFPNASLVPNTINIRIGVQAGTPTYFKDDGSGNILYISGPWTISSGTIDYVSGALVLNFTNPPRSQQGVRGSYTINNGISIAPIEGIYTTIDSTQNVNEYVEADLPTKAQILAIGDINSGSINAYGSKNVATGIPGSFINISPN